MRNLNLPSKIILALAVGIIVAVSVGRIWENTLYFSSAHESGAVEISEETYKEKYKEGSTNHDDLHRRQYLNKKVVFNESLAYQSGLIGFSAVLIILLLIPSRIPKNKS